MRFHYINLKPANLQQSVGGGYFTPNECLTTLSYLAKQVRPTNAASIASGGEVPLAVLLPICDKVVAVDHAESSVGWSCMKALLLEAYDTPTIKLFLERKHDAFFPILSELYQGLPNELKTKFRISLASPPACHYVPGPPHDPTLHFFSVYQMSDFTKYWSRIPEKDLDAAREKLECLTIASGDISDLVKLGEKFDFLYASNCMEHANRHMKQPRPDEHFVPFLKSGAYILLTGANYCSPYPYDKKWKVTQSTRTIVKPAIDSWTYTLLKNKPLPYTGIRLYRMNPS